MKATHNAIARGFAKHANDTVKLAFCKEASRRWLEDGDLVKLCRLFKSRRPPKNKRS